MRIGNEEVKGTLVLRMWLFFAMVGAIFHYATGWSLIHELSHAVMTVLTGGKVLAITFDSITVFGYTDEVLFAGTFGGVIVRAILIVWLVRSRRSMIVPAWIWGRMIMEWASWWIGNGDDASMLSSRMVEEYYTMVLLALGLMIMVLTTVIVLVQAAVWWESNPKHMMRPSIFRKGQLSRV